MNSKNHQYDQFQAALEKTLTKKVQGSRNYRQQVSEKFGHIDQYRVVRDQAEYIAKQKLTSNAKNLLLAAALDRLAQMGDFNPVVDLEAMLATETDEPEIEESEDNE